LSNHFLADDVDPETLDQLKQDRVSRAELEQISGIGPIKARQLVAAGCRTVEQLRTSPDFLAMLSNVQRAGVTYFRHIEERVSRVEAETVAVSNILMPRTRN
jgi:DNA polymerase beta